MTHPSRASVTLRKKSNLSAQSHPSEGWIPPGRVSIATSYMYPSLAFLAGICATEARNCIGTCTITLPLHCLVKVCTGSSIY